MKKFLQEVLYGDRDYKIKNVENFFYYFQVEAFDLCN